MRGTGNKGNARPHLDLAVIGLQNVLFLLQLGLKISDFVAALKEWIKRKEYRIELENTMN